MQGEVLDGRWPPATIDLAVCEEGIGHARTTMNEVIAGYSKARKPS